MAGMGTLIGPVAAHQPRFNDKRTEENGQIHTFYLAKKSLLI